MILCNSGLKNTETFEKRTDPKVRSRGKDSLPPFPERMGCQAIAGLPTNGKQLREKEKQSFLYRETNRVNRVKRQATMPPEKLDRALIKRCKLCLLNHQNQEFIVRFILIFY